MTEVKLTPKRRREQFEGLLQYALDEGLPPPTDSGLHYELVEALTEVAAHRSDDAVAAARATFAELY